MIKEKDIKIGNKFFYMTAYSDRPHLVEIINDHALWEGKIDVEFSNGRKLDVDPVDLYHSWKEAIEANPPEEHLTYYPQGLRRRHFLWY